MNRSDVRELHYIAPITNVASILRLGVLSHVRSASVKHESVAMEVIQERRTNKRVPGARNLHHYVNLYFDAHNAMLSRIRERNDSICVLRIDSSVLDLPETIVADRNASSEYVIFRPAVDGLSHLDKDRLFARYWTHPDNPLEEMRHKSEKCAEVPVPERVAPEYVLGAYVASPTVLTRWQQLHVNLTAEVKHGLFF